MMLESYKGIEFYSVCFSLICFVFMSFVDSGKIYLKKYQLIHFLRFEGCRVRSIYTIRPDRSASALRNKKIEHIRLRLRSNVVPFVKCDYVLCHLVTSCFRLYLATGRLYLSVRTC